MLLELEDARDLPLDQDLRGGLVDRVEEDDARRPGGQDEQEDEEGQPAAAPHHVPVVPQVQRLLDGDLDRRHGAGRGAPNQRRVHDHGLQAPAREDPDRTSREARRVLNACLLRGHRRQALCHGGGAPAPAGGTAVHATEVPEDEARARTRAEVETRGHVTPASCALYV